MRNDKNIEKKHLEFFAYPMFSSLLWGNYTIIGAGNWLIMNN